VSTRGLEGEGKRRSQDPAISIITEDGRDEEEGDGIFEIWRWRPYQSAARWSCHDWTEPSCRALGRVAHGLHAHF